MVGAIVDGNDAASCPASYTCPVGHTSPYYAALGDGYFYFGLVSGGLFSLTSLQASLIGTGQASFPYTAGALLIQGFDAPGEAVGEPQTVFLPGSDASGDFALKQHELSALSNNAYSFARIFSYHCDFSGRCNRDKGLANVAIDNMVTQEAAAVPEPGSLALIGLAALGLGLRRRSTG